ncbi:hypothetical protein [Lentibacillus cibarius]|uniref:Flagellar protein n=1 Tax=Lentibacillus cibarius TaxID=2583219 RepID=A0A5S3QMY6_9BACI|nr:hypothetical protein [Lentibacillus cibarius]TMN21846.1 hypothetical protein FFL34_06755 [Lentibacillus cibarius]
MKRNGLCVHCGKIDQLMHDLCNECYEIEQNNIKAVKKVLFKYPNSNAIDLSIKTGISIDGITRLIKKGTLI